MPAPALNIPVRASLDDFKKSMNETSTLARNATRKILDQFSEMNKGLAVSGAAAGTSWALGWVGRIALVVGSFKLMGEAISATRDQLKEMVAIADKSRDLGVSPAFLQSWNAVSRQLTVGTEDLEAALSHAFQATKDRAPIDLSKWETGEEQITAVEKVLRVYNATYAKTAGQQLEGLILFREADSQEAKIQAVLKAMIQLRDLGQQAAALDVGEKMFGTAFVDRIRQGRTSAESILATMREMQASDDGIYSSALVTRAKQVDDQLRVSEERLSRALKPSFDDLASVMLTIKNIWADTVGLIGQAVEAANKFGILGNEVSRLKRQRDELDEAIKNGGNEVSVLGFKTGIRLPGDVISADQNKAKRDEVQARIDDLERQPNVYPKQVTASGPGPAPTLKPTGSDTDRFDASADAIDKRTSALQAEAAAIDLGTAAREKAKLTAQLETVAKQANAAAGLGENVVTQQQRDRINEVTDAYANAALAMDKARVASQIKFDRNTAFLSPEDVQIAQQLRGIYGSDIPVALASSEASAMRFNDAMRGVASTVSGNLTTGLTDMLDGTKSLSQGFLDLSKTIVRALEEAMVKMLVVQPIMRGLQGILGFSGGGEVSVGSATSVGAATGGLIRGPGTGTSDSIPARLSDGEFVVNASQTAKHLSLLRAINDNAIPKFANGGLVGAPTATAGPMIGGQTIIAPSIAVSVQGNPGASAADHAKLGENIAKSVEPAIRKIVADEMRTQSKPGGTMWGRRG